MIAKILEQFRKWHYERSGPAVTFVVSFARSLSLEKYDYLANFAALMKMLNTACVINE